jgi:serine/threonine-protein kinase
MALTDPMVLPADLALVPVAELPADLRARVDADEDDWAVTRPHSRTPTRIVDSRAAELLREFQRPKTIVEAVMHFSRAVGVDPNETLDAAFPMLQGLLKTRFLVEAGSKDASRFQPSLETGEQFAGCEILRCLQALEDVELYQVRNSAADTAALKVARAGAGPAIANMLRREAAILAALDGAVSPKLLLAEASDSRPYLLLEWCPGIDGSLAAAELYRSAGADASFRLLQLCHAIATAYTVLQSRHVLHGDIHPRNVLVTGDYQVKLIDFGLSRLSGVESEWRAAPRGGVAFFLEPEYAETVRAGHRPPPTTALGEQYSVAALLYSLLAGAHYRDFSLDQSEMLRQIAEDWPLPLSRRGRPAWPELECVLGKALSKKPADRFASMAEFADALERVSWPAAPTPFADPAAPPIPSGAAASLLAETLEKLGPSGAAFHTGVEEGPTASVNFGSAGIAYALYRIAAARQDPALLSLADLWAQRAVQDAGSSRAFHNPALEIEPAMVGRISPYHTVSGIHCVQALIARARDDAAFAQRAIQQFAEASRAFPCDNLDITLGRSGTVMACALLLDAFAGVEWINVEPLLTLGNDVLRGIWEEIDRLAPIRECKEIEYTGAAHGWSGILYAALHWRQASGTPLMPGVEARLQQLAAWAEPVDGRLRWRWGTGTRDHGQVGDYMVGWCHGSAGHVFTWTLAYEVFGDPAYLDIAERAALDAWNTRTTLGNLCCGLAGQAYALLNIYRHTRQAVWIERARELADQAAVYWRTPRPMTPYERSASRPESLYKGELGVAVLAADVGQPEFAAMPFYEAEGWPK